MWVFAEERSGSTWTSIELSRRLGLPYYYVEDGREDAPDSELIVNGCPSSMILHTHRFSLLTLILPSLPRIRVTRRNALEQFTSFIFMQRAKEKHPDWWLIPHIMYSPDGAIQSMVDKFDRVVEDAGGILVMRDEVRVWAQRKKERNALWEAHSNGSQTVYYEDLAYGVEIPPAGVLSFDQLGPCMKLPYNKPSIIWNMDEVAEWVQIEAG